MENMAIAGNAKEKFAKLSLIFAKLINEQQEKLKYGNKVMRVR